MASVSTGTLLEQATSLAAMSSSKPQDIRDPKNTSSCLTPPNTPMVNSAPWGSMSSEKKITPSFEELMSEQLAAQLQLDEDKAYVKNIKSGSLESMKEESASSTVAGSIPDTSDDVILAQMLQAEMDKEHNEYITKKENQVNKNSKVRLTFNNFRTDEMFASDEDDGDEEDYEEEEDEDLVEDVDPSSNMLNVSNDKGYVMFGKEVVTKHDHEICGRKNTAKLEDGLPPEFNTGDARGMDLQLSNRIFNSLRKHAMSEQRRGQRLHENKERYTAEHAVDERTRLILHRLVDRGIIASVNGVISIGKEAVVIHADGGDIAASDADSQPQHYANVMKCVEIPKECAIKVFKTTLNEFRARDKYIKDDFRFKDRFKKLNPRKIIHMWAEKEMHNLVRMTEAGICCPEVVLLRKHVLVMSFIGENQQHAPKLKDALLSTSQKKSAYSQVLEMMKTLYDKCKLIHADLSEFNLLWHDSKVWMIDVSQSVEPSHPHGLEFLLRDCTNISKFFTNLGVPDVLNAYQLFNEVSGLNLCIDDEASFLSSIEVLQNSSEEHSHQGKLKSSQIFEQSAT